MNFSDYLNNNFLKLSRWIIEENIEAYRLYDRDIREYPVSIDIYNNIPNIYIYENNSINLNLLKKEIFISMEKIIPGITYTDILFKIRKRQKDGTQYEKLNIKKQKLVIKEYDVYYKINLSDYLDTGIFLDHRSTRKIFSKLVKNKKRLLNLFSYTGAFSLVAAKNGVEFTTSVDMSNTYCDWAKENILLNQFNPYKHIVIRENVFFFLENIQSKNWKFDFIVIDPPTVSRSKKMLNKFDIQRDYPYLINKSSEYLNEDGQILFSTNYRKFKFNPEYINLKNIRDITESTIPPDFKDPMIHRVYLLSR